MQKAPGSLLWISSAQLPDAKEGRLGSNCKLHEYTIGRRSPVIRPGQEWDMSVYLLLTLEFPFESSRSPNDNPDF